MAVLEGLVDLADAMAEDVGEAEQDRQLDAALPQLIHEFLQVDGLASARLFGWTVTWPRLLMPK